MRLQEGDFDREQVYADDPAATVDAFAAAGATWVHVVDLDGARAGERRQTAAIKTIRHALRTDVHLQVGGGIRSRSAIDETLAAGAARVVLGTAAIEAPDLTKEAVDRHGTDKVAVALDVRDGLAVGHGWVRGAPGQPADGAITALSVAGVRTFIVTGIDRDGLLGGPDLGLLEQLIALTEADVIASGGVATIDDLKTVQAIGCSGAIVGRALYDGRIDLAEALTALR